MKQMELVDVKKFVEREVEIPKIEDDQVLIKVKVCGICGSDIHSYTGRHPFVHPPIVLGHEYCGTVTKIGKDVKDIQIGDRVTSEIVINCGKCKNCKEGNYQICNNGRYLGNVSWNGAMAEYVVMTADKVYRLPAEMTNRQGAMIEPAAVGVHAVSRSDYELGDTALVIGAGVIGNLTAQALKAAGAEKVIITDLVDKRLDKAEAVGIDYAVNASQVNLPKWLAENVGEDNLDIIYDCVGSEKSVDTAISLAKKGSQIVLVGVPPLSIKVNMAFVQDRELDIKGSLQYLREDYLWVIKYIIDGRLEVDSLITHVFPFAEYQKAFDLAMDAADNGMMKVMMEF